MHKSVMLNKKRRVVIADYWTPLPAQMRCLFPHCHTLEELLLEACADGTLKHERRGFEQVSFDLREPKNPVNTEVVLDDFTRQRLEPANINELLAFRKNYPRITTGRRIVALGTRIRAKGRQYVPYYGSGKEGLLLKLEPDRRTEVGLWRFDSIFLGIVPDSREKVPNPDQERRHS